MVIGIFGISCTGKSTIASEISNRINATIYIGKDYLRLAKNEADAKKSFIELLTDSIDSEKNVIYVISEMEHLSLLPDKALRIFATADIDVVKERFSKRMNGVLPPPVAAMLESKYDMFANERYDVKVDTSTECAVENCNKIMKQFDMHHIGKGH